MFKHYLKMAIRQILKNKIQYLLSIIGIAVGLLCFSITSYYIRRFNNQFIAWANSDRMANIYAKSAQYGYEDPYIPGEVVQELMGNPITGIGQIAYSYGYGQANISISKENQNIIGKTKSTNFQNEKYKNSVYTFFERGVNAILFLTIPYIFRRNILLTFYLFFIAPIYFLILPAGASSSAK